MFKYIKVACYTIDHYINEACYTIDHYINEACNTIDHYNIYENSDNIYKAT